MTNAARVFITGIGGFAGSYLARYLLEQGSEVYGLVRRRADSSIPPNIVQKNIQGSIHFLEGYLEEITSLESALEISQPDVVYHLAAQSFVPRSFSHPIETAQINTIGTNNLLEAIRRKEIDPTIVFAGSSEEYGLVFSSQAHHRTMVEKYGTIYPEPTRIPEVPITEANPLRPMSPYAVSKVCGDHLMRNYYYTYGVKGIVSRAFNHEGAGRGIMFVTSVITSQIAQFCAGEINRITIGNVNAFRDWSHVMDTIRGYCLIAESGNPGDVYNQGSMRTTSVLSYLILGLETSGFPVDRIETLRNGKCVREPASPDKTEIFGTSFEKTKVDRMILEGEIEFALEDGGLIIHSGDRKIPVQFDPERFRPAEVPILFSDTSKIQELGFRTNYSVRDIIQDQLNSFLHRDTNENRHLS
ncbi:MAG: GDP-mannose 4,6-dehydratase [Methanoregulaceae archaeon]|nr:GDP-mannose 4,6-dehydratase [Methanoregulaceae archaeon]